MIPIPTALINCLTPCASTPLHRLTCGHLIRTSFLSRSSSSCASNCSTSTHTTAAEPEFLCPTCYRSFLNGQYARFVQRCENASHRDGIPVDLVVKRIKVTYDSGVKGEKEEFDRWYDVWLGEVKYEAIVKESYAWRVRMEGKKKCKPVKERVDVSGQEAV